MNRICQIIISKRLYIIGIISTRSELFHPITVPFKIVVSHTRPNLLGRLHQIRLTNALIHQLILRQLRDLLNAADLRQFPSHGHIGSVPTNVADICTAASLSQFYHLLPVYYLGQLQLFQINVEHLPPSLPARQRNVSINEDLHIRF